LSGIDTNFEIDFDNFFVK